MGTLPNQGRFCAALAEAGATPQLTPRSTPATDNMRFLIQRSPDPVPYLGAYFRIAGSGEELTRVSLVLAPTRATAVDEQVLARLLGLVLVLGDRPGGPPIRQLWLEEGLRLKGKMDSEVAPSHAVRAERLARRVQQEWSRFVGNALARLRGEPRGDAHFCYPNGDWSAERPAVQVIRWPPLPGEALPELQ